MLDVHVCTVKNNFTVGKLRKFYRHTKRVKPTYFDVFHVPRITEPGWGTGDETILCLDLERNIASVYFDTEQSFQEAIAEGNEYKELSTSEFGRIVDAIVGARR